jgi:site-specific DNA recombinase
MRAAIYARFSSELQDMRSITDQVALARKYAEGRDLSVYRCYEDAAISGASTINRPGLQQLIRDAEKKHFDVLVTESLDRLSRNQADIATLYERLTFIGVRVETLADGVVSEIHVGLKGTMSALFLKDLAQKTRRGQVGRVKAGRIPGGKSYGYDVVGGTEERGKRTINLQEAEIVRRIFREYAAGKGPMAIVKALNGERQPGPTGRVWNATALLGSPKRRNGVLNNELYRGMIVYNRQRFVKHPLTGKRVARENPETEWLRQEVPELRIVDEPLWDGVQQRRAVRGGPHLYHQRRPRKPLSGLIYCGCCGARYIIATHGYLRCSARANSGTCDNARTILMSEIEQRVLGALRNQLLATDLVQVAVEEYRRERTRLAKERRKARLRLEVELADVTNKIERMLDLLQDGNIEKGKGVARVNELTVEEKRLTQELAADPAPAVVEIYPYAGERYAEKVAEIHVALAKGQEAEIEAVNLVRSLIQRIDVHPTPGREPMRIEVVGTLYMLLKNEQGREHSGIVCCGPPQPSPCEIIVISIN